MDGASQGEPIILGLPCAWSLIVCLASFKFDNLLNIWFQDDAVVDKVPLSKSLQQDGSVSIPVTCTFRACLLHPNMQYILDYLLSIPWRKRTQLRAHNQVGLFLICRLPPNLSQCWNTCMKFLLRVWTPQKQGRELFVFLQWTSLFNVLEPHIIKVGLQFTRIDGTRSPQQRERCTKIQENPEIQPHIYVTIWIATFRIFISMH